MSAPDTARSKVCNALAFRGMTWSFALAKPRGALASPRISSRAASKLLAPDLPQGIATVAPADRFEQFALMLLFAARNASSVTPFAAAMPAQVSPAFTV